MDYKDKKYFIQHDEQKSKPLSGLDYFKMLLPGVWQFLKKSRKKWLKMDMSQTAEGSEKTAISISLSLKM
jgi:hypothetical protein